jgi:hypothetical protein
MGNILPASREITTGNRYKNKNVSINKQIRNVVDIVDLFAEEKGGLSKRMHKLRVFFIG